MPQVPDVAPRHTWLLAVVRTQDFRIIKKCFCHIFALHYSLSLTLGSQHLEVHTFAMTSKSFSDMHVFFTFCCMSLVGIIVLIANIKNYVAWKAFGRHD